MILQLKNADCFALQVNRSMEVWGEEMAWMGGYFSVCVRFDIEFDRFCTTCKSDVFILMKWCFCFIIKRCGSRSGWPGHRASPRASWPSNAEFLYIVNTCRRLIVVNTCRRLITTAGKTLNRTRITTIHQKLPQSFAGGARRVTSTNSQTYHPPPPRSSKSATPPRSFLPPHEHVHVHAHVHVHVNVIDACFS